MLPLAKRYLLRRRLGAGATAEVHLAEDSWAPGRLVAIKLLGEPGPSGRDELRREFAYARRLRHPGLARVHEIGGWDGSGRLYVASDFVDGRPLDSWASGRPAEELIGRLTYTARTLAYMHTCRVVHGDIKPAHLLVRQDDDRRTTLIDLGLGAGLHEARVAGTLGFMAPELLLRGERSGAADVFALASTAAAALLGRPPAAELVLRGEPAAWSREVAELLGPLPRPIADWISPALAWAPEARPSALAWAAAGEALLPEVERLWPALPEPFVARVDERRALERAFDGICGEVAGPELLVVTGPPASGKSRLVDELATHAELAGGLVLGGERLAPEDPFERLWAQLLAIDRSGLVERRSGVADVPASAVDERCRAAVRAIDALAREAPIVVWLDGVEPEHLLARRFIAAVQGEREARRLRTSPEGSRWLVAVTASRAEALGRVDEAQSIQLGALSEAESAELLGVLLPAPPGGEEVRTLHALTGGNPGVLIATARTLAVAPLAGRREVVVPGDVGAMLDAQLEGLSAAQRDRLTAAACFDAPTAEPLLAAALESAEPSGWVELRDRGLLTESSRDGVRRWRVAGDMLRRRLRERSDGAELARRHRRVMQALRAAAQGEGGSIELGLHLVAAGEAREGLAAIFACTDEGEREQPVQARSTLSRVSAWWPELDDTPEMLARTARLDLALGEAARAASAYEKLCTGPAELPEHRAGWARALTAAGRYEAALAAVRSSSTRVSELDEIEGRLLVYLGRYEEAAAAVAQALGVAGGDERRGAALGNVAGLAAYYRGDLAAAEQILRQALAQAGQCNDVRLTAMLESSFGMTLQKQGRAEAALAAYEHSLELVRQLGDGAMEVARLVNLGTLHQDRGELERAFERYRAALEGAARLRLDREVVRIGYNLANLLIMVGALDEAARLVSEARVRAERLTMAVEQAFLWLLEAEIRNLELDPGRAEAALEGSWRAAPAEKTLLLERDAAVQRAQAALSRRDFAAARRALAAAPQADDATIELLAASIEIEDPSGDRVLAAAKLRALEAQPARELSADRSWRVLAAGCRLAASQSDARRAASLGQRALFELDGWLARVPVAHRDGYLRVPAHAALSAYVRSQAAPAGSEGRRGRVSELGRILEINKRLGRQSDKKALLELILDEAVDLTEAERGFVLMRGGEGGLEVQAARHLDLETLHNPGGKISHSVAERVIESGEAIVTVDAMEDERFRERLSVHSLKLRSIACVPLEVGGRPAGALYLDNRFRANAFAPEVVDVLRAFADQASIAVAQAELRDALLTRQAALEASQRELAAANEALHRQVEQTAARLSETTELLESEREAQTLAHRFSGIIGKSHALTQVLKMAAKLARTDFPVYIHGESGTGKELLARAIHANSQRASGPFLAINCAAIPEALLESELFGSKRGAFTGAVADRRGLLALADGGTLFLDEIGDMSAAMQAKLLRVLEEKAFRPVGGQELVTCDVRVLSASHKDLAKLVPRNLFREDLFYRLTTATVRLPPLSERTEDIPGLVEHLLARAARDARVAEPPSVTPAALAALRSYRWPGNVRELDNELRRAMALADGTIDVAHLSERLVGLTPAPLLGRRRGVFRAAIADYERRLLAAALAGAGGDATEAARTLGLSRSVCYAKLKRYGLSSSQKR